MKDKYILHQKDSEKEKKYLIEIKESDDVTDFLEFTIPFYKIYCNNFFIIAVQSQKEAGKYIFDIMLENNLYKK